jgi:hypothetical protein
MKKLFFLPFLMITCFCLAQNAQEIIGKPIKIGNLLVAQNDFPVGMNWMDAQNACTKLGKGWRLPSKDELNVMYKNKEKIGNFANDWYWSFTWIGKNEFGNDEAVMKHFNDGLMSSNEVDYEYSRNAVRAVSEVNVVSKMVNVKKVIGKPIKIGNLLVAENDFPDTMDWNEAKKACRALGKGWRLPTKSELNLLYNNKREEKIRGFVNGNYWSSTEAGYGAVWLQDFSSFRDGGGGQGNLDKASKLNVRAIKSL